ncbi:MAG: sulfur oxidation c-type cytochrome SoxX [Magnetococcales bacterium]|nr:sulfur oxidation c-type cytochrome SoxX [Magnetococcales bacterium]
MKRLRTVGPVLLAAAILAGCASTPDGTSDQSRQVMGIATPLTDKPGDPVAGKKLANTRSKGNCVACHNLPDAVLAGNAGPDLVEAMNNMERSTAWIRQKIVDPKVDNPDTLMFTFYSNEGKKQVRNDWIGKRVLEAQEVEDIIAYLLTLRQ